MSRPERFSDSFTTHEATFSVDVARPHGERKEAVILKIDCAGAVSFDEDGIDLVTEMLEKARDNLRARRGRAR
jgi:hypothetical protein